MNFAVNRNTGPVSPMRSAAWARPEAGAQEPAPGPRDAVSISGEARQALEGEELSPVEKALKGATQEQVQAWMEEWQTQHQLEVNWNATVDPDGQIWCKSYFDSYASQVTEFRASAESAIKDYYADAYQEALDSPLGKDLSGQLNFIAAKYNCSWSEYFDASMPAGERQWAYTQVRAMLTGTGLRLNDPYALKGLHIPDNEEIAKIAKQSADDTISELVRQAKEANSPHQG